MTDVEQTTQSIAGERRTRGFALPTILITSIVMLMVLLVSVSSTVAVRMAIQNQYYTQLAQVAGEAGTAYAKVCMAANGGTAQWSNANPLKPNTDCTGTQLAGFSCPSADARCSVTVNGNIRTRFSVPLPTGPQNIPSTGIVDLLRTSNSAVWRTYTQNTAQNTVVPLLPPTGGTISYSGGYTIHTFTTSGTFTISSGSASIQYLVIGGGGGGGQPGNDGGGGGAGGYRSSVSGEMSGGGASAEAPLVLSTGSYTVTVGDGGVAGGTGGNSVFSTITSLGGGCGGAGGGPAACVGGSGGGGGSAAGAAGTAGQGYLGGYYATDAGGGGGAGGTGNSGNVSPFSKGGVGISSSIDGTPTYRGGGGGGGIDAGARGLGGNGGGGNGGYGNVTPPTAGTANTGGGGGGAGGTTLINSAAGGSGIVIIRYLTP